MIQKKKDKKKKETTKKVFVYDKPTAPGEKKGNQIKTCKELLNLEISILLDNVGHVHVHIVLTLPLEINRWLMYINTRCQCINPFFKLQGLNLSCCFVHLL